MLRLHDVEIIDTFAEAFPIKGTRLLVTACDERWAGIAAAEVTGNATSVIACDVEAGIERVWSPDETPDGRPGISVLMFGFSRDKLETSIRARVGQCVLTCPTTACFNGIDDSPPDKQIRIGGALRYFGDGFQMSKQIAGRRYWRIPVMDGEFVCEDRFGTVNAIAGGNLLICGSSGALTLAATDRAVAAMREIRDVIMPFPGGIVRSGSKVGSKYKGLRASTNDPYCPTLRPVTDSALPPGCGAVYEIVIDGLGFEAIQQAMRVGLQAAVRCPGILQITAGNYGGKLGKHHFHLRDLL